MATRQIGERYTNRAADRLIGIRYPLPMGGFVSLVDYLGGDRSVLRPARMDGRDDSLPHDFVAERVAQLIKTRQPLFKEIMMVLHLGIPKGSTVDSNILKDSTKFSGGRDSAVSEFHWRTTFHNLMHILPGKLESNSGEAREFANAVGDIARAVAPHSYAAFERHIIGSVVVSVPEQKVLRMLLRGESLREAMALAGFEGQQTGDGALGVAEFELLSKLRKVLNIPKGGGSILDDVDAALSARRETAADAQQIP